MKKIELIFALAFLLGAASVGLPNTLCAAEFEEVQQPASKPLGIYSSIGIDTNKAKEYLDSAGRMAMKGQHERAQQLKADVANELRRFIAHPTMYSGPNGIDTQKDLALLDLAGRMQMSEDTHDTSAALKNVVAADLRRFIAHPTGLQTAGGVNTQQVSSLLDLADRMQMSVDTGEISVDLKSVVADELRRFVAHPTMYSGPAGIDTEKDSALLDLAQRMDMNAGTHKLSTDLKAIVAADLRRFIQRPTGLQTASGVNTSMVSSLLDLADRMDKDVDTREISVDLKNLVSAVL
ncbi:MAG: hypothetical protein V4544_07095 [Pseudomonadota bacterium]